MLVNIVALPNSSEPQVAYQQRLAAWGLLLYRKS